ncbi:hypothetical protein M9Y10_029462 [Tritrichomonas musculus]|uniref:Surface antigen BspA-like n=1 Tax=Tritrichomonas musculus TaxID=1915356 RepID=A0ABR2KM75_9EUKA
MINKTEPKEEENQIVKKIIKVNELVFSINEEEKTAEVIACQKSKSYLIPKSITYVNQEFIVTSINEKSFLNVFAKSIEFPEDSKVRKIAKNAFQYSHIDSITIPASVSELEEGWNSRTYKLSNITISPSNQNYKKWENLIIGKSDTKSDTFDVLVFVSRDSKKATIPPGVKRVSSYSFSLSSIEKVTFPSSVIEIGEFAFFNCFNLVQIEFAGDSKLETIESNAFFNSSIEELNFPASLSVLKNGWCNMAKKLKKVTIDSKNPNFKNNDKLIIGKSDIKSDIFDVLEFASRDVKTVTIPSKIEKISPYSFQFSSIEKVIISPSVTVIGEFSFSNCLKLADVEIPPDSQLEVIQNNAFHISHIKRIFIPRRVRKICESAFDCCLQLEKIEFAEDSNLCTIENSAFSGTIIESINVPKNVSELKEGWCSSTQKLTKVTIDPDNKYYEQHGKLIMSKSDNFNVIEFASRDIKRVEIPPNVIQISAYSFGQSTIEKIVIPSSVKSICKVAFYCCKLLESVEIPKDSKLENIGSSAFYFTSIRKIFIPAGITEICIGTFDLCKKLQQIEFPSDSKLEIIGEEAFAHAGITSICIPPHVTDIRENAFYECYKLQIIEIDENSSITKEALKDIYCPITMIPKRLEKNFI